MFLLAPVFSRQIMVSNRLSWGRCQPACSGVTSPDHRAVTLLYFCISALLYFCISDTTRVEPSHFASRTVSWSNSSNWSF